jgi:hypothetical protein
VNLRLQNFTIEAWIKRASTNLATLDTNNINGAIFHYGTGGYGFTLVNDGRFTFTQVGIGGVFSTNRVTDTNWHHVAVTRNGNAVVFYIDGVPETAAPYNPNFTFTTPAAIGARGSDMAQTFNGSIDELKIYNRALTGNEILGIYSPTAQVALAGGFTIPIMPNQYTGNWSVSAPIKFFASQNNQLLRFTGITPGVFLDGIKLVDVGSDGYALPEVSLDGLKGEQASGTWKLEVWDSRAGAPAPIDALTAWKLSFVYTTVNFAATPSLSSVINAPPVIGSLSISSEGNTAFAWTGNTNDQYVVEWTDDLTPPVVWNDTGVPIVSADGTFNYIEEAGTNAPATGSRFYRLRRLDPNP